MLANVSRSLVHSSVEAFGKLKEMESKFARCWTGAPISFCWKRINRRAVICSLIFFCFYRGITSDMQSEGKLKAASTSSIFIAIVYCTSFYLSHRKCDRSRVGWWRLVGGKPTDNARQMNCKCICTTNKSEMNKIERRKLVFFVIAAARRCRRRCCCCRCYFFLWRKKKPIYQNV